MVSAFNGRSTVPQGDLFETCLKNKDLAGTAVFRVVNRKVKDTVVSGQGHLSVRGFSVINHNMSIHRKDFGKLFKREGTEHVNVQGFKFVSCPCVQGVSHFKQSVAVRPVAFIS